MLTLIAKILLRMTNVMTRMTTTRMVMYNVSCVVYDS